MEKTPDARQDLIQLIIELELAMFRKVNARGNAPCQEMPETFRAMRWMAHSVLSEGTLSSYLDDLKTAAEAGRNLMTEKYARMDNFIPPPSRTTLRSSLSSTRSLPLKSAGWASSRHGTPTS
ncbi:MAG: DUF4125 family protein [Desulfomonilia bacterium]